VYYKSIDLKQTYLSTKNIQSGFKHSKKILKIAKFVFLSRKKGTEQQFLNQQMVLRPFLKTKTAILAFLS